MTANQQKNFTEEELLRFYDCDCKGRMRISSILKRSAEIAGHDYTNKGYGYEALLEKQMVFLLSRVTVKILKYPTAQQMIKTTTWEYGKKGAMFLRGTEMTDQEGSLCISLDTGWILANPITRKIYKSSYYDFDVAIDEGRKPIALPLSKIKYTNLVYIEDRKINVCDIDENGHVYNAIYADIAQNVMPMSEFQRDLTDFRINYVSEAKLGDNIKLYKEATENICVIVGKVNDKVCFETEFIFQ